MVTCSVVIDVGDLTPRGIADSADGCALDAFDTDADGGVGGGHAGGCGGVGNE